MNQFDYTLRLQEVQGLKYKKHLKEFAVKIHQDAQVVAKSTYGTHVSLYNFSIEQRIFYYHLFLLAIQKHGEGLPQYITNLYSSLENSLIDSMKDKDLSYQQIVEAFKFTKFISFYVYNRNLFNLDKVIEANELPCTFNIDFRNSLNYGSISKVQSFANLLMELTTHKRDMGNAPLTVTDQLLAQYYKEDLSKLDLIEAQIEDYNKSLATIKEKLNETSSVQDSEP